MVRTNKAENCSILLAATAAGLSLMAERRALASAHSSGDSSGEGEAMGKVMVRKYLSED